MSSDLVRLWHAEHILTQESQDHVVAHRRSHQQTSLSKLSFHIIVPCEPISAIGRHTHISSLPSCFGRKQLGHVRFSSAFFAPVELGGRRKSHEIGRFNVSVGFCNGELYSLIRADGLSKNDSIGGVF